MKDRIRQVRKSAGLTQTEFGEKLGLTKSMIAQVETDKAKLSDRSVKDICREFDVNYEWLTTGQGEPYVIRSENQQLLKFFNETIQLEDENVKKKIVSALSQLSEEEWKVIEDLIDRIKAM